MAETNSHVEKILNRLRQPLLFAGEGFVFAEINLAAAQFLLNP